MAEMVFVVYRKEPCRVYSVHRSFAGASAVKQARVADGESMTNIEIYGLYLED